MEDNRSRIEELKELGWSWNDIVKLLEELKEWLADEKISPQDEEERLATSQTSMERRVTDFLKNIGVPFHLKGMMCLRSAIIYCFNKNVSSVSMTKDLYPSIAEEFGTTPSRVERAIRHAVERTFDNCNPLMQEIFKCTINPARGKPTNSQFIWTVVEYLK